jgi:hypothetical protein
LNANRPCAISCGLRLGLSIWWRSLLPYYAVGDERHRSLGRFVRTLLCQHCQLVQDLLKSGPEFPVLARRPAASPRPARSLSCRCAAPTPNIFSSRSATACFWVSIGIFISLFTTPALFFCLGAYSPLLLCPRRSTKKKGPRRAPTAPSACLCPLRGGLGGSWSQQFCRAPAPGVSVSCWVV